MNNLEFNPTSHEYKINGKTVPSVTQIISRIIPPVIANPLAFERAGQFGKAVHKACELSDLNQLDYKTFDAHLQPYLSGWHNFCNEYKGLDFTRDEIEQYLYSKKYGFAGTLDRLPKFIGGKYTLLDIKTSAGINLQNKIQLGGYSILSKEFGIRVERAWIVHLIGSSQYKVIQLQNIKKYEAAFLHCLSIYNLMESEK